MSKRKRNRHSLACPCNSGLEFKSCCEPYISIISFGNHEETNYRNTRRDKSILLAWKQDYSPAISDEFYKKVQPYIYRISRYLDDLMDLYLPISSPNPSETDKIILETYFAIKHNFVLSIFASVSCIADSLLLQSGVLLRSAIEDTFVLMDIAYHPEQLRKFMQDNYKASSALTRIKPYIPSVLISWYGYFSANFTHAGPLHRAPYLPRACYPDNWILVTGLQNIVRAVVAYHIILERIYFPTVNKHFFWIEQDSKIVFDEDSPVFTWSEKLGNDIVKRYPPNEEKPGFIKSERSYTLKT